MRENNEMNNVLPRRHVETHPREEHRRELRNQMLAAFQREEQKNQSAFRPRVRRWTERAAVLAAGVVLGLGCGWFFHVKPPTEAEPPTAAKPPVVLVLEYASPPETTKPSKADYWADERLKHYWEKSRTSPNQTTCSTRWTPPFRLSDILGEIQ